MVMARFKPPPDTIARSLDRDQRVAAFEVRTLRRRRKVTPTSASVAPRPAAPPPTPRAARLQDEDDGSGALMISRDASPMRSGDPRLSTTRRRAIRTCSGRRTAGTEAPHCELLASCPQAAPAPLGAH